MSERAELPRRGCGLRHTGPCPVETWQRCTYGQAIEGWRCRLAEGHPDAHEPEHSRRRVVEPSAPIGSDSPLSRAERGSERPGGRGRPVWVQAGKMLPQEYLSESGRGENGVKGREGEKTACGTRWSFSYYPAPRCMPPDRCTHRTTLNRPPPRTRTWGGSSELSKVYSSKFVQSVLSQPLTSHTVPF